MLREVTGTDVHNEEKSQSGGLRAKKSAKPENGSQVVNVPLPY